jgi:transposase InsO family protein
MGTLLHWHIPSQLKILLDDIYMFDELPTTILTDKDKIFTSLFWKELFKKLGVKLLLSTFYHPQTDSQTERVNQCLDIYLRCIHAPSKEVESMAIFNIMVV